jgi:Methyltransferase domain
VDGVPELVHDLIARESLTGATLSKPRRTDPGRPTRMTVDPIVAGGELRYRWRHHEATRTTDESLAPEETERRLVHLIGGEFRQALLRSTEADFQVLAGKDAATVLRRKATRPRPSYAHDRRKRRLLEEGTPVPFLVELGVMTGEGRVKADRFAKFRQVSRFLELADDVLGALPAGRLTIVDFGSGKSYLTFALHHLVTAIRGRDADIVGLDLKEDVVASCESLARRLGADGLRFETGDIAGYSGVGRADLVVSLHACDTATDSALARAVRWEASAILAVPCCQHELAPQLENAALGPLLSRGLLRERFAADVTDAVRAQLLEAVGYDAQLVEFVELEHTPKNVLIRAVRRSGRDRAKAFDRYLALKATLHIDPALERLLAELLPSGG